MCSSDAGCRCGHRSKPASLNILRGNAGVFISFVGSFNSQVIKAGVPALPELGAPHTYYGDFIFDTFHFSCLLSYRSTFPEVVIHAAPLVNPSKSHFHRHAYLNHLGFTVGHYGIYSGIFQLGLDDHLGDYGVVASAGQVVQ